MSELFTDYEHRMLSAGPAPASQAKNKASPFERFLALILIVFFAAVGGFIVKVISTGLKWNHCKSNIEIKALLPKKF